jgi:hypothetical protein
MATFLSSVLKSDMNEKDILDQHKPSPGLTLKSPYLSVNKMYPQEGPQLMLKLEYKNTFPNFL